MTTNALVRYASHADVTSMLSQLSSPGHVRTRANLEGGDSLFRNATADALRDVGREPEADLLASGRHVVVHQGQVHPGRFTITPMAQAYGRLQDHLDQITGGDHHVQWEIWNPSALLGGVPEDHWEDRDRVSFHIAGDDPPPLGGFANNFEAMDYNPGVTETYHILEGRDRLMTELNNIAHVSPRVRQLVDRVATAPVEEVDPGPPAPRPFDFRRYAAPDRTPIETVRRYARPSDDHAGFLRHLEANPDDLTAYHAYADWHRDMGFPATGDFIERAANLEDTRPHNWRVDRHHIGVPYDAPKDAEREVSLILGHSWVGHPTPYTVQLWQRSPDGKHALWRVHDLNALEALDWERRLAAEGASLPLYRRHRGNPYRPKPRL